MMPAEVYTEITAVFTAFAAVLSSKKTAELARKKKSDFTRSGIGKLPLYRLLVYVIFRNCKDTTSELSKFFSSINENSQRPSRQAANKRLRCLNYNVWPYLSKEFSKLFYASKTIVRTVKGFVVLAADSSSLEMPYSQAAADQFGFRRSNHVKAASDSGKILVRCGGLYDVVNHLYVDYEINSCAKSETEILSEQLRAFKPTLENRKKIILGDRGYVSLSVMALAQMQGYHFCIRAKKSTYKAEVGRMSTNDEYVDIKLDRTDFSRIRDEEVRTYLAGAKFFRVRVVKKYWTNPETGAQELIIYFTNLSPEEFGSNDIVDLYSQRWAIEQGYATLKTVLELERHVSLDPTIAVNMLYGKIMFYNFCALFREQLELILPVDDQRISPKSGTEKKKHMYTR